jgi:hypothetical protein
VNGVETRLTHPEFLSSSIVGGPKFGRTSILRYVARLPTRLAADGTRVLHVSYDAEFLGQNADACDFWNGVLRGLRAHPETDQHCDSINKAIERANNRKLDEYDLQDALNEVATAGKRVAVLIDNFDNVLRADVFWNRSDFFHQIRTLGQTQTLAFVVASVRPLLDYWRQDRKASPFFNIFENYKIKHLTEPEIGAHVKACLDEEEIDDDGSIAATVTAASAGHPLVVNYVLMLCVEARQQKRTHETDAIMAKLADPDGPIVVLSHRIRDALRPSERHWLDQLLENKPLGLEERKQLMHLRDYGLLPPGVLP